MWERIKAAFGVAFVFAAFVAFWLAVGKLAEVVIGPCSRW